MTSAVPSGLADQILSGHAYVGEPNFEQALRGRSIHLAPLLVEHYEYLRSLELTPELALRGRLGGRTPGPEEYAMTLNEGVLAQYVVVESESLTPLGLVSAYNAIHPNGTVFLGAWKFPVNSRPTGFMEGVMIFLHYLFFRWPFRKIYLETPEYNLPQFASGLDKFFEEEASLKQYYYMDGSYWDRVFLSISRERFETRIARFKPFLFNTQ